MTDAGLLAAQTLDALGALRRQGALSASAEARCAALMNNLTAPVRIGLFGLPGSGKRRALTALTGFTLTAPAGPCPTIEIAGGDAPATQAILSDGCTLQTPSLPDIALMSQDPVFLQITSPTTALANRVILLAAAEANPADMLAGLTWAAPRVDLAIWCSAGWSDTEASLWMQAPDRLRNHSILLTSGALLPADALAVYGFDARFEVHQPALSGAFSDLAAYLEEVITEARLHDIHAAQLVLKRYAAPALAPGPDAPVASPPAGPAPRPRSAPPTETTPPEAQADLARLFHAVRSAADDLLTGLGTPDVAQPDALLMAFEQVFETLADRVDSSHSLQDTWPELATQVTQAYDLSLLLRIEGGAAQLAYAGRLLLQVRHDIEDRLAA